MCLQNKTHALNNEIVVNALAGVVGVGITYIKDDEDIIPLLKVRLHCICQDQQIPDVYYVSHLEVQCIHFCFAEGLVFTDEAACCVFPRCNSAGVSKRMRPLFQSDLEICLT